MHTHFHNYCLVASPEGTKFPCRHSTEAENLFYLLLSANGNANLMPWPYDGTPHSNLIDRCIKENNEQKGRITGVT